MFKKCLAIALLCVTTFTGCWDEEVFSPEEQAQINMVAAPGTPLSRGDFFEFRGGCFALNLIERPFDNGVVHVAQYPETGSALILAQDLARYGARLVRKERNEEALHKWLMQDASSHDCFFKEKE